MKKKEKKITKKEWNDLWKNFTVLTIDGTLKHGFNKPEIDSFCLYYGKDRMDDLHDLCERYYKKFNKDIYIYFKSGFAWVSWNSKHRGAFTRPSLK